MASGSTIFISYSHKDEQHKDFVVSHLKVAERQGVFDVWDDRRIKGGGNWQADIDTALDQADIGVLLISRHFLTSDFIMDHEVQTMLQRHASEDVILYPILISDCTWQSVDWLKAINIRPKDGVPLNSFDEADRDQVMAEIAAEIAKTLHPEADHGTIRPAAIPRRQPSSTRGGFWAWWQTASVTARATVLGTVFAGLALVWGIVAVILPSDSDCTINTEQGIAACDDVEIGGDVNLGQPQ